MRVALVTTMKAPDHPVPSGDRTFARLLVRALALGGHEVIVTDAPSTWRASPPDPHALVREAHAAATRIAASQQASPPDAILTYHNYHKAPDLVGPALADAFGVPYAIVEASRAASRAAGPWAAGFAQADEALAAADAVAAVSDHDALGLAPVVGERLSRLAPFTDVEPFLAGPTSRGEQRLVAVAMLRPGRKADGVQLLARVFARVQEAVPTATLTLAGDGPARAALEPLFPPGAFVGALSREGVASLLARSDLFVWPALGESFGFAFLEAQAAGLPVVAGNSRGVRHTVEDGTTARLVPEGEADAMADAVIALLNAPHTMRAMGAAARRFAMTRDLASGSRALDALLAQAAAHHAQTRPIRRTA